MEKETNYKYIVYCTTNLVNGFIYVGYHKTLNPYIFDSYIGNGIYINQPYTYKYGKTKFQQAVKKYGVSNFKRTILAVFSNEASALELEADIVNEEFLKRNDVYNMVLGGLGPLSVFKIKVFQYDINGNYMAEYESITQAALIMNVDDSAIGHALRKKAKSCNSFWSTDKVDKLDLSLYNLGNNHKVVIHVYNVDGTYYKSYSSITECAKEVGCTLSEVRSSAMCGYCVRKKYYCSYILSSNYDKANTIYIKNRKVYKYDSNGNFLQEYESQELAEKLNKGSNITKFIKNKRVDKNGFMWALIKVPNYNEPDNRSNSKKQVGKYDLSGNLITIYESATTAAKENGTSVWKVLSGTNKTHKKHIYKYIID